ncbi:FG-GAP-like repeat-containing protein [bacterium]|nr:FG-GAP-like repeat-containing protein [bacterium]
MKISSCSANIWRLVLLVSLFGCVAKDLTVQACPPPTVYVSIASSSGSESVTTKYITVSLSMSSAQTITVPFSVNASSTATGGGTDYSISSSPLIFNPGQTTHDITLTIYDDALDENDETIVIDLGTPTNATLGSPSSSTYTIQDNDNPPTISISSSSSGNESTALKTVTATLSAVSGKSVTVPFTITGGTATNGTDYAPSYPGDNPITIPAGQLSGSMQLWIIDDALDEDDETIIVGLGTPTNATLGSPSSFTYTIQDNDNPPTVSITPATSSGSESTLTKVFTVSLSAASGKAISVPYSVSGTATSGSDYSSISPASPLSFAANETSKQITLTITNDSVDEDDETVVISLGTPTNATMGSPSSATYTIQDDDDPPTVSISPATSSGSESSTSKMFTVSLSAASGKTITVPFSAGGTLGTGEYTINTATPLTFSSGQTSQNINVTFTPDGVDEPDETLIITLGAPTNANLGSPYIATYTVIDDDDPPSVTITSNSSGNEDVTTKVLTVTLSAPSGMPITVPFNFNGSTATGGGIDYSSSPSSPLSFGMGETSKQITLTINDDTMDEPDETVVVNLTDPVNVSLGTPSSSTYTIQDNDDPPTVTIESQSWVAEGHGRTVIVRLSAASGYDISIPFTVTLGPGTSAGDYNIAASPLVIPAGQTQGAIVIQGTTDGVRENEESIQITIGTPDHAQLGSNTTSVVSIWDNNEPLYDPSSTLASFNDIYSGYPFVEFDTAGNLRTHGYLSEHVPESILNTLAADQNQEWWILYNGDRIISLIDLGGKNIPDTIGNIYLKGEVARLTQPLDSDLFTIDNLGQVVSSIDLNGNLFLKGDVQSRSNPVQLSAQAVSDTRIDLTWTYSENLATAWEIWYRLATSESYQFYETLQNRLDRKYEFNGLQPGTEYRFVVRPRLSTGVGIFSNEASASTGAASGMHVSLVVPPQNDPDTSATSRLDIMARFNREVRAENVSTGTLSIQRSYQGALILNPNVNLAEISSSVTGLKPGEMAEVTITSSVLSTGGLALQKPFVWRFTNQTGSASAYYDRDMDTFGSGYNMARQTAVGDLNGDGKIDVVVACAYDPLRVYLNDGAGKLDDDTSSNVIKLELKEIMPSGLQLADIDRDNRLDIVVLDSAGIVWVMRNLGGTPVSFSTAYRVDLGLSAGYVSSLDCGDINGDGWIDLAVGCAGGRNMILINDASGLIAFSQIRYVGGTDAQTSTLKLGDLNGDGSLDVLTGNQNGTIIYLNNGSGVFPQDEISAGVIKFGPETATAALALGDLNHDEYLDIVCSSGAGNIVYLNDHAAGFGGEGSTTHTLGTNSSILTKIILGDVDGDGDLDAAALPYGNRGVVYLNGGFGEFNEGVREFGSADDSTPDIALADMGEDQNRDLDVVEVNFGGYNAIYYNLALNLGFGKAFVLNTNAETDTGEDEHPAIATDNAGHWMAAWNSNHLASSSDENDYEILMAGSQEGAPLRWNAPRVINSTAEVDNSASPNSDTEPHLAADGHGGWLVTWKSYYHIYNGTPTPGTDADLLASYSSDNGTTWSTARTVNTNAHTDNRTDSPESIATDGAGRWIVVWRSASMDPTGPVQDEYGPDMDLFYSISINNGTSWTTTTALSSTAQTDLIDRHTTASLWLSNGEVMRSRDENPTLKYSRTGTWLCAWDSNTTRTETNNLGLDFDILFSRSTDGGATWSPAAPLNTNAAYDEQPPIENPENVIDADLTVGADTRPSIATNQNGVWVATWSTCQSTFGILNKGHDSDIVAATSLDDGQTWSNPVLVNSDAATDDINSLDSKPTVETDGNGNWFVIWTNCTSATTETLKCSQSIDNGLTWTPAQKLYDATVDTTQSLDLAPIALDQSGHWAVAWAAHTTSALMYTVVGDHLETKTVTVGPDSEIFYGTADASIVQNLTPIEHPLPDMVLTLKSNVATSVQITSGTAAPVSVTLSANVATSVTYPMNSELRLTADFSVTGGVFKRWYVDGKEGPTTNTLRITMDDYHSVELSYKGFWVTSVNPAEESTQVVRDANVTADLNKNVDPADPAIPLIAYGSMTGRFRVDPTVTNGQISLNPERDYERHETIQATVPAAVKVAGESTRLETPYTWHFTAKNADKRSSATFDQGTYIGDTASSVSAIAIANVRRLDQQTTERLALLVGFNGAANKLFYPKLTTLPGGVASITYPVDKSYTFDSLDYIDDPIPHTHTRAIAVADLNSTDSATASSDALDVVVGNYGEYSYVYRTSITLTVPYYRFEGVYRIGSGHDRTTAIAIGDLDGNGHNDIVMGNEGQCDVIYFNDGWGAFGHNTGRPETTINNLDVTTTGTFGLGAGQTRALCLADIDLDGSLDIVAGYYGRGVRIYRNDGIGGFAKDEPSSKTTVLSATGMVTALAVGDFDGNGYTDIAVGHDGAANMVWMNDGQGNWTSTPLLGNNSESVAFATTSIVAADLNGDGALDLAIATEGVAGNLIYLNDGHGVFRYNSTIGANFGTYCETKALAAADVSQDGRIDLVTGNFDQPSQLWIQDAASGFSFLRGDMPSFVYDWVTPYIEEYLINSSVPEYINEYELDYGFSGADDIYPKVATDGQGHWLLAWSTQQQLKYNNHSSNKPPLQDFNLGSDYDIVYTMYYDGRNGTGDSWHEISIDPDTQWTMPVPVASSFETDGINDNDVMPSVATDGNGNWAMCWQKLNSASNTISIYVSATTTVRLAGANAWDAPTLVATRPYPANVSMLTPKIICASSDNGSKSHWMILWTAREDNTGDDTEILISRGTCTKYSEENLEWWEWDGDSWTETKPLTDTMSITDTTKNNDGYQGSNLANDGYVTGDNNTMAYAADVATDGDGKWIAVWQSETPIIPFDGSPKELGYDIDILFSYSTNNGQTWTKPCYVNVNASNDSEWRDIDPKVLYSGEGNWQIFWSKSQYYASRLDYCCVTTNTTTIFDPANLNANGEWKKCPWGTPQILNGQELPPESGYEFMIHYPIEVASDGNGNITALYSAGVAYDWFWDFHNNDPAISTYQIFSNDNGKTWSVPQRMPQPITYEFSIFYGSYYDTGTPALCMDSSGQAMAVYSSLFSYSFDANLLNLRTSGLWPKNYNPPKLVPEWEWGIPTSIEVEFTSDTLKGKAFPGSICRIPTFPFEAGQINPLYPYRVFPDPDIDKVNSDPPEPEFQSDADLHMLADDDGRCWNIFNVNTNRTCDPITAPLGTVVYFHTPVFGGDGITTITKPGDIGRIDLTWRGFRLDTPQRDWPTSVSLWVFKGGQNGADKWADPAAWEMVGPTSEWPRALTNGTTQTASITSNFSRYISLTTDTTHRFGYCSETHTGIARPAGTLTWAVFANNLDSTDTHWLSNDYAAVKITKALAINTQNKSKPYLNTWGTTDTLQTTGTLPCIAKPGPFNGQVRLDLITTSTVEAAAIFRIYVERAEVGMLVNVISASLEQVRSIECTEVNDGIWQETVVWDYRTQLGTTNARIFENELISGDVSLEMVRESINIGESKAFKPDWDRDGLSDYDEQTTYHTDPRDRDSDDDGLRDGEEIGMGTDPLKVDTDGDHLADSLEVGMTTDTLHTRVGDYKTVVTFADTGTTEAECVATDGPINENTHTASGLLLVDMDYSTRTDPLKTDTDGDGFWDGPTLWVSMGEGLGNQLRVGEDKNGNGKYKDEAVGRDGEYETVDDETDPNDIASCSKGDFIAAADLDGNLIPDFFEDYADEIGDIVEQLYGQDAAEVKANIIADAEQAYGDGSIQATAMIHFYDPEEAREQFLEPKPSMAPASGGSGGMSAAAAAGVTSAEYAKIISEIQDEFHEIMRLLYDRQTPRTILGEAFTKILLDCRFFRLLSDNDLTTNSLDTYGNGGETKTITSEMLNPNVAMYHGTFINGQLQTKDDVSTITRNLSEAYGIPVMYSLNPSQGGLLTDFTQSVAQTAFIAMPYLLRILNKPLGAEVAYGAYRGYVCREKSVGSLVQEWDRIINLAPTHQILHFAYSQGNIQSRMALDLFLANHPRGAKKRMHMIVMGSGYCWITHRCLPKDTHFTFVKGDPVFLSVGGRYWCPLNYFNKDKWSDVSNSAGAPFSVQHHLHTHCDGMSNTYAWWYYYVGGPIFQLNDCNFSIDGEKRWLHNREEVGWWNNHNVTVTAKYGNDQGIPVESELLEWVRTEYNPMWPFSDDSREFNPRDALRNQFGQ